MNKMTEKQIETKQRKHDWYLKNKDTILAQQKAYREANKDVINSRAKVTRSKPHVKQRTQAYLKGWEAEHKSWRREYNRRYYAAHREELIQYAVAYQRGKREAGLIA